MKPSEFYDAPLSCVLPPGATLRWLGTAGFELAYDGHILLLDPYVTRVGLWNYLTRPLASAAERVRAEIPRADAIVVGHSHFDHVMDVPTIAAHTGAVVIGSRSTANLMRLHRVPESQIRECVGRATLDIGPFRVTLVPSVHSEFALGHRVPYAGDIPCTCEFGGRGRDYRCGDVFGIHVEFGGRTIYHLGSANLLDAELSVPPVDLFLMGISGRHATERFIPRVLDRVRPQAVIPMHYDNFFRPANAGLMLLPLTKFGRFVDETLAFDKQITVRALPISGVLGG